MKKTALLLISIFYFITASFSQETKAQTQQAAMQQLKWLVGRWTGRSELSVEGHTIVTYVQEIITPMLDETIYTVSARGSSMDSTTGKIKPVYNSFGVIS